MPRPEKKKTEKERDMERERKKGYVKRTQKNYSLLFKLQVVDEVEKGLLTYRQAQNKYEIQGRTTVPNWLRKHSRQNWEKGKIMIKKIINYLKGGVIFIKIILYFIKVKKIKTFKSISPQLEILCGSFATSVAIPTYRKNINQYNRISM